MPKRKNRKNRKSMKGGGGWLTGLTNFVSPDPGDTGFEGQDARWAADEDGEGALINPVANPPPISAPGAGLAGIDYYDDDDGEPSPSSPSTQARDQVTDYHYDPDFGGDHNNNPAPRPTSQPRWFGSGNPVGWGEVSSKNKDSMTRTRHGKRYPTVQATQPSPAPAPAPGFFERLSNIVSPPPKDTGSPPPNQQPTESQWREMSTQYKSNQQPTESQWRDMRIQYQADKAADAAGHHRTSPVSAVSAADRDMARKQLDRKHAANLISTAFRAEQKEIDELGASNSNFDQVMGHNPLRHPPSQFREDWNTSFNNSDPLAYEKLLEERAIEEADDEDTLGAFDIDEDDTVPPANAPDQLDILSTAMVADDTDKEENWIYDDDEADEAGDDGDAGRASAVFDAGRGGARRKRKSKVKRTKRKSKVKRTKRKSKVKRTKRKSTKRR